MDEFPGNSRRPRPSENNTPQIEDKKLDKVVTGNVIRRKKSLGRRLMDTFFSGDSSSVFGYLLREVLVPALQATATDMVTQGIEKAVYGEVRSPRHYSGRGSSINRQHISYDRPNTIIRSSSRSTPPVRRPVTQPSAMDIGDIIIEGKLNAQIVVDKLFDTVEEFGAVSVANLYELLGQSSVYTDHKWGWTDLTDMTVKRVREGHLLVLPPLEDLR